MRVLQLLALLLVAGCSRLESLGIAPRSPHERYVATLEQAELLATEAGRQWQMAAQTALTSALPADLPFREVGYFDPREPQAAGYRFTLRAGAKLAVRVDAQAPLFVDLFRVTGDSLAPPDRILSADSTMQLEREARRDETLILRLQPRLLEGGRYEVTLETGPSLGFPVSGHSRDDIRSFWGASRDGGARRHEGVDVFAPRGTPVVAASDGIVTRTGSTRLGGNVVWVRDLERGIALYYAHLDTQLVSTPKRVRAGDTLGTVGNTGNAQNTPPHLHFGIYSSGAIDPLPFIDDRVRRAPRVQADTSAFREWHRLRRETNGLASGTPVRVVARTADGFRVADVRGNSFTVPSGTVERATSIRRVVLTEPTPLLFRPETEAPVLAILEPGSEVAALGNSGAYRLVQVRGRTGWIL